MTVVRITGAPELRDLVGADETQLDASTPAAAIRELFRSAPGSEGLVLAGRWALKVDGEPLAEGDLGRLASPASSLEIVRHSMPAAAALPAWFWWVSGALVAYSAYSIATLPDVSDYSAREEPASRQRHLWSGGVNSVEQGGPVPLVYGKRVRVGSVVVSAGSSSDIDERDRGMGDDRYVTPVPSRQLAGGEGGDAGRPVSVTQGIRTEGDPGGPGRLGTGDDDETGTDPDVDPGDPNDPTRPTEPESTDPDPDEYTPAPLDQVSRARFVDLIAEGQIEGLADPGAVLPRTMIAAGSPGGGEARLAQVAGTAGWKRPRWTLVVPARDDDWETLQAVSVGDALRIDQGASWLRGDVTAVAKGPLTITFSQLENNGAAGTIVAGAAQIRFPDEDNRLSSVFLDGTPLRTLRGQYNFSGVVDLELLRGRPDQDGLTTIGAVETELEVGASLRTGFVSRNKVGAADAVRVTLRVPQFWRMVDGELSPALVRVQIVIGSKVRGYRLMDKLLAPGEVSVVLPLGAETSVKVKRTTEQSTDLEQRRDEVQWRSVTWIRSVRQTYRHSAVVGLTLDADQMSGRVPRREYELAGARVEVPQGYSPLTRAYPMAWNGNMGADRQAVDNPAWALFDLLRHRRYGLGAVPGMRDAVWSARHDFYGLARWCDASVAVGAGADMEPRWRLNASFARRLGARQIVEMIASACRAGVQFEHGKCRVWWDEATDPVALLGDANVVDGEFVYGTRVAWQDRVSAVAVTWHDPDDGFRPAVELVISQALVRKYGGLKQRDVVAVGCTSRGQAHRIGRAALYEQEHENDTLTCVATWDNAHVVAGDVVLVADSDATSTRLARRVLGAPPAAGRLVLDENVDATAAAGIRAVTVRRAEGEAAGTALERTAGIARYDNGRYAFAAGGEGYSLQITKKSDSARPAFANVGGVVVLEMAAEADRPSRWRVAEVAESAPLHRRITMTRHSPEKWAVVESRRAIASPGRRTSKGLKPPKAITLREEGYVDGVLGDLIKVTILAESAEFDVRQRLLIVDVRFSATSAADVATLPWERIESREIAPSRVGWYQARARWFGGGVQSGWRESAVFHADGQADPLGDLESDPTLPQWAMQIRRTVRVAHESDVDLDTEWYLSGSADWRGDRLLILGGLSATEESRLERLEDLVSLYRNADNWALYLVAATTFSGAAGARKAEILVSHVQSKGVPPSSGPLTARFFPSGLDGPDLADIQTFTLSAAAGMVLEWTVGPTTPDLWRIRLGTPTADGGINWSGQPSIVDGAVTRFASGDQVISGASPVGAEALSTILGQSTLSNRLYVRVQGLRRDGSGYAAYGADVASAEIGTSALATPGSWRATPGNARITLDWDAVAGAAGYDIYRDTSMSAPSASTAATHSVGSGSTVQWVDTGRVNGTTYSYWIRTRGSGMVGAWSGRVSATPTAGTLPSTPPVFSPATQTMSGTVGAAGSAIARAATGTAPIAYAVSGALPAGVAFASATRRVSWTAAATAGALTIRATNSGGSADLTVTLRLAAQEMRWGPWETGIIVQIGLYDKGLGGPGGLGSVAAAEQDGTMRRWERQRNPPTGLWSGATIYGLLMCYTERIGGTNRVIQTFQNYGSAGNRMRRTDTDSYFSTNVAYLRTGDLNAARSDDFDFVDALHWSSPTIQNRPLPYSSGSHRAIAGLRWRRDDDASDGRGTQFVVIVPAGSGQYIVNRRRWEPAT